MKQTERQRRYRATEKGRRNMARDNASPGAASRKSFYALTAL